MRDQLIELARAKSPDMQPTPITISDLVFEERVLLSCFHCRRNGVTWTCPPNIPNIDYKQVLREFDELLLICCKMPFEEQTAASVRRESTNLVHRTLLEAEKLLWDNNYPLAVSFIGGSCKLCAQGCATERCRQPHLSRIPMEATGINVVKSVKNVGINVSFPPRKHLYRVGLLGW